MFFFFRRVRLRPVALLLDSFECWQAAGSQGGEDYIPRSVGVAPLTNEKVTDICCSKEDVLFLWWENEGQLFSRKSARRAFFNARHNPKLFWINLDLALTIVSLWCRGCNMRHLWAIHATEYNSLWLQRIVLFLCVITFYFAPPPLFSSFYPPFFSVFGKYIQARCVVLILMIFKLSWVKAHFLGQSAKFEGWEGLFLESPMTSPFAFPPLFCFQFTAKHLRYARAS